MGYRGYGYEYKNKKNMQKRGLVFKLSKGQYADLLFIEFFTGIVYIVECKTRQEKRWYPTAHDKKQFYRLQDLKTKIGEGYSNGNEKIKIRYHIREAGNEKVLTLEEVEKEYFKPKDSRKNTMHAVQ